MNNLKVANIARIGEYGEDIYDFAKLGQWAKANRFLGSLQKSYDRFNATGQNKALASRLGQYLNSLSPLVTAQNRLTAMQIANQITYSTAKYTAKNSAPVPLAVTLLDYYGRELELGSLFGNAAQIQTSQANITRTWNAVQSSVINAGGAKEVKQFDSLVSLVNQPNLFAGYSRLATKILDGADKLETVYLKNPPPDTDAELNGR